MGLPDSSSGRTNGSKPVKVRVGSLPPRDAHGNPTRFTTVLTKRRGAVSDNRGAMKEGHDGINVYLENPVEDKSLHMDVFVEVEIIH